MATVEAEPLSADDLDYWRGIVAALEQNLENGVDQDAATRQLIGRQQAGRIALLSSISQSESPQLKMLLAGFSVEVLEHAGGSALEILKNTAKSGPAAVEILRAVNAEIDLSEVDDARSLVLNALRTAWWETRQDLHERFIEQAGRPPQLN